MDSLHRCISRQNVGVFVKASYQPIQEPGTEPGKIDRLESHATDEWSLVMPSGAVLSASAKPSEELPPIKGTLKALLTSYPSYRDRFNSMNGTEVGNLTNCQWTPASWDTKSNVRFDKSSMHMTRGTVTLSQGSFKQTIAHDGSTQMNFRHRDHYYEVDASRSGKVRVFGRGILNDVQEFPCHLTDTGVAFAPREGETLGVGWLVSPSSLLKPGTELKPARSDSR